LAELAREALLCGFLNAELLADGLRGGAFRAVGAFGFETAFGLDAAFGFETDGARAFAPPDDLSRLVAPRSLAFAVFDRPDPPGFSAESDFGRGRSADAGRRSPAACGLPSCPSVRAFSFASA
jgi:hypothetical protein